MTKALLVGTVTSRATRGTHRDTSWGDHHIASLLTKTSLSKSVAQHLHLPPSTCYAMFRRKEMKESGFLYEIPLIFIAYGIIIALLLPVLIGVFHSATIAMAIIIIIGLGASHLTGLSITAPRVKLLKIPICIWIFLLLCFVTVPLSFYVIVEHMIPVLMVVQLFASFWIDYRLAIRSKNN